MNLAGVDHQVLSRRRSLATIRADQLRSVAAQAVTDAAAVIETSRALRRETAASRAAAARLRTELHGESLVAPLRYVLEYRCRGREHPAAAPPRPMRALADSLVRAARERLRDARDRLRTGCTAGVRGDIVCVCGHAEAICDWATACLDFEVIAYAYSLARDADRLADELLAAE